MMKTKFSTGQGFLPEGGVLYTKMECLIQETEFNNGMFLLLTLRKNAPTMNQFISNKSFL